MEFTGERVVPDDRDHRHLYYEHMARYAVSQAFVLEKRVLDVGCGTGYGCAYLATCGAESVVGVDLSEESVNYARANFQLANLSYVQSDAIRLPFADGQFDVCVSFEVIEHIADDVAYLQQIKRVLDGSGRLFLSTPNKKKSSPDTETPPNPFHVREYLHHDLYRLLTSVFPYVQILGQNYAEGFHFVDADHANHRPSQSVYIPQGVLPYHQTAELFNASGKEEIAEEPDYFLAMCSLQPLAELGVVSISMAGMDTVRNELAKRNHWVDILQDEKAVRDDRIRDLEQTLVERDKWLAIIRAEQAVAQARITDVEQTLAERENWINQLRAETDDTIKARENWIQILIGEKEARDARINELERAAIELQRAYSELEHENSELQHANRELQHANRELQHANSELLHAFHEGESRLEVLKMEADQQMQLSIGMRAEIESLTTRLEDRESQLVSVEAQLSDKITQLEERDKIIYEYEMKLINRVIRKLKKWRR